MLIHMESLLLIIWGMHSGILMDIGTNLLVILDLFLSGSIGFKDIICTPEVHKKNLITV